jgi:hypothetical protein
MMEIVMKLSLAYLFPALVAVAVGCAAPAEPTQTADESALTSAADRPITAYTIAHSAGVEGRIPDDGNIGPGWSTLSIASPASKPITTYFSRVQAGRTLNITTSVNGIYKLGDPPPGWTGECYESCLPWIQIARFDRAFLGYKLPGGQAHEVALREAGASIAIPENTTGTLEYWFRFEDAYHRSFWDSRRGENYRVEIIPAEAATIHFGPSGPPTVTGSLRPGGAARVEYTLSRFTSFSLGGSTRADKVSRLEVAMSFDGMRSSEWVSLLGEAKSSAAVDIPKLVANGWTYYPDQVLVSPVFLVPASAVSVNVWAVGEAINLDVSPVRRPFLLDGRRGMSQPTGGAGFTVADVFDLPLAP